MSIQDGWSKTIFDRTIMIEQQQQQQRQQQQLKTNKPKWFRTFQLFRIKVR